MKSPFMIFKLALKVLILLVVSCDSGEMSIETRQVPKDNVDDQSSETNDPDLSSVDENTNGVLLENLDFDVEVLGSEKIPSLKVDEIETVHAIKLVARDSEGKEITEGALDVPYQVVVNIPDNDAYDVYFLDESGDHLEKLGEGFTQFDKTDVGQKLVVSIKKPKGFILLTRKSFASLTDLNIINPPTGITNRNTLQITGKGIAGNEARVYCLDQNSELISVDICGGTAIIGADNQFLVDVHLGDQSGIYSLIARQYYPSTNTLSKEELIGSPINLDLKKPAFIGFSSCPSGRCLSEPVLSISPLGPQTTVLTVNADEMGHVKIYFNNDNIMTKEKENDDVLSFALGLSHFDSKPGSHEITIELSDFAGNTLSATKKVTVLQDFGSLNPNSTAATSNRNYTLTGKGYSGLSVIIRCFDQNLSAFLDPAICGGEHEFSASEDYLINISLPDMESVYEFHGSYLDMDNSNEGSRVKIGSSIHFEKEKNPTDINLSHSTIDENNAAGAILGFFSTVDSNSHDNHSYSLVSGLGDNDNALFEIANSQLKVKTSLDFESKPNLNIRIRSTDSSNLHMEKQFSLSVNDLNESITDVVIDSTDIDENSIVNAVVGNLSSIDEDTAETHTYVLVNGAGDADNSSFNINGSQLRVNASFDHETKNSYNIRVKSTGSNSHEFEKAFVISTNDLNEAPIGISLDTTNIDENVAANSIVGNLSTSDPDSGDSFTYALVTGVGDTDNASFNINNHHLRINAGFDFETKNSYSVRVRSTDNHSLQTEDTLTISVNDVNEAPTDIILDSLGIMEGLGMNTLVADISATDQDSGDSHTYTLVSGSGDTDNANFSISGGDLVSSIVFSHATQATHSIRLRVTDDGTGTLTFEKSFTINIDVAPTIDSLQNDSMGDTPKFVFQVTGGGNAKLAYGTSKADLENWDGLTTKPGSVTELLAGTGNCLSPTTTGCSFDLSSATAWEPYYVRVIVPSSNSYGATISATHIVALVPDGMVYVDKDAWPDESGLNYADFEKFSFAIDKYEGTANGTINDCATNDHPCSGGIGGGHLQSMPTGTPIGFDFWTMKQACIDRPAAGFEGTSIAQQIRMVSGIEWTIAAYGTPDQGTQGYCNVDNRPSGAAAPDESGTNDNSSCISYFGVRNMIGNRHEWTDEILHDRNWFRFIGASDANEVEVLPMPIPTISTGYQNIYDFDPMMAYPRLSTRSGPWDGTNDRINQGWDSVANTPTTSHARALQRGGGNSSGAIGGRFFIANALPGSGGGGGRCAISSPAPGHIRFANDSEGSTAKFRWRLWGDNVTIRLAFAKEGSPTKRSHIDSWNGSATGSSLSDNVYTVENFSGCDASAYNSEGFEVLGTGSTTSGAFGLQGRCAVDLSGLNPWEVRYVRLYANNGSGSMFSDTFAIARVPDGMVFVAADDWPDSSIHRLAAEYGETHSSPFNFAIDKWEVTTSGTVNDCTTDDFPCSGGIGGGYLQSNGGTPYAGHHWYTYKHGCDARTSVLGATWADTGLSAGDNSGRRVHLATGIEWSVAAFETPDSIGPQYCNSQSAFWNPGQPADQGANTTTMQSCLSRYGARNMIGNNMEWTNDLVHDGQLVTYWTEAGGGDDVGIPGTWDVATNAISTWNFSWAFPTASTAETSSFFQADFLEENSGALSGYGSESRGVARGGYWDHAESAGRFSVVFISAPTSTWNAYSGRCALVAP